MEEDFEEVQKYEFRLIGLSRSGNHAIINWLINQLEGSYCFLNCSEPKHNPYLTARPMWEAGDIHQTNMSGFDLQKEQAGEFLRKDYLLYNHEDCFLGPLNTPKQRRNLVEWVGPSAERKDILILRDPFNLFASRIKAGLIRGHYTHHGARPISLLTLKRIYKQHAREFLREKNYLRNKVSISFNSWSTDKDYRRLITEKLDLPFTDSGFREVPKVAGGSSFDGVALSGKAHKMDVNNRWKEFVDDGEYWSLFDPELVALTQQIFGRTPALQYALDNHKIKSSYGEQFEIALGGKL